MKKKIIPLVVLLGTIGAYAQTGIGTPLPHGTAELEISSKDKGVLIPRVELVNEADTNTVKGGTYPESLLVYNTGVGASRIEAGFYFWNKDKWSALVSNSTLYKYIKETAKDGNVTITNTGGNNFTFTWVDKTTDKETSATLEELIKGMETVTTLTESSDGIKATLTYKNEEDKAPKVIDLTTLLEGSSEFNKFLIKFVGTAVNETITTIEPGKNADNKNSGTYTYLNELKEPVQITVVDDVTNNFDKIINNEEVQKLITKYVKEKAEGNVIYEGGKFYYVKVENGIATKEEIKISELVKANETDTPITRGAANANGTESGIYNYTSEGKQSITINVVEDVANNFDKVITNNEFKTVFNKYFNDNVVGNVTYKNNKFYYTVKNGDKYEDKEISIDQIIQDNALASITINPVADNKDGVVGGFTFKENKDAAGTKYAETLTSISQGVDAVKGAGYIAYNYKDETGKNATTQITVTADVIKSFEKIIQDPDVITHLNTFISGATGSVTVVKNAAGDIVIGYKDVAGDTQTVNLTTLIAEKETKTTITVGEVAPGGKRTGVYTYKNEDKVDVQITVVDDVTNNFDKIINNEEVQKLITKYVNEKAEGNVIYEGGKFYYVKVENGIATKEEIKISELVKANETDTPITRGAANANGTESGIYNYTSEGKKSITINVVEDVANNFDKVITNNEFKTIFNKYLTDNVEGNVTYKNDKFYYTVKNQDGTFTNKEIELKEIIKENSVLSSLVLTNAASNKDLVKGGFAYKADKTSAANDVEFAETLTSITRGKDKSNDKLIAYDYKDETGNIAAAQITVSADVIADFEQIIKDPKVNLLLQEFITNNTGNVTVTRNGDGDVVIKYPGGEVNLTTEIASKQKFTEVALVTSTEGTKGKGVTITTNKENTPATTFEESLTKVDRYNNKGTKENATAATADLTYYEYLDESGKKNYITVSQDVSNDFSKIVENNKTVIENIVKSVGGNASVSEDKGNVIITNVETGVKYDITKLIKDNGAIAKLDLTPIADNADKVKGGFKFASGKEGDTEVKFAETLTSITKGKDKSNDKLIAYDYKDETGNIAVAQITVSADVIDNFNEIIKDNKVITELNNFISGATGSVTVTKKPNGDIVISYKDGNNPAEVNLTTLIAEKETKTDIKKTNAAGAEVAIDTKPVNGMTFYEYENENKQKRYITVSQDVSDDFSKIVENNKSILETLIKNTGGNASVSKKGDDLIITNVETKEEFNITKLIKDNGAIAELKLVTDVAQNKDSVKAGFTFKDGKDAVNNVAFAETLTKITRVPLPMFVYEEIDPNTGAIKQVHTETERPGEIPVSNYTTNKFVYTDEAGNVIEIKGSDLFSGTDEDGNTNGGSIETLTSLVLDLNYGADLTTGKGGYPALVYTDEKLQASPIPISKMFQQSETVTTLEFSKSNRELIYTNELISKENGNSSEEAKTKILLDDLVQEPWYVAKDSNQTFNKQATSNQEDIYTNGWVGIGYDRKSPNATGINEKLRVNGSITATNSYYADYVFESYFDGYSNLKYDYKFNDLNTVGNFIKTNRHLPGITPISDLEKTSTGYSFNVSELSIQLLEKTEELFLHVIDQQKELNAKEERIEKLETEMTNMAQRLQALEALLTK